MNRNILFLLISFCHIFLSANVASQSRYPSELCCGNSAPETVNKHAAKDVRSSRHPGRVFAIDDGSGDGSSTLIEIDVVSGEVSTLLETQQRLSDLALDRSGNFYAVNLGGEVIRIDVQSGELVEVLDANRSLNALVFAGDQRFYAADSLGSLYQIELT